MRDYKGMGIAVLCLAAAAAMAQNEAEQETEKEIEEIVVTGSRLVVEKFVDFKRNSTDIVDSLGENEIATLPALNAAEVVKLLPGVTVFNDGFGAGNGERGGAVNQPTTLEERFASIRGIRGDLNLTMLDGLNLAIPNQTGRTNFLDWFPVNLAKRIEVAKTFTAEQDANAIGGIINVVTRSGFDYDEPLLNMAFSVNEDEIKDGPEDYDRPYNLSIVYAAPISEKFAIAATANFNHRDVFMPHRNNEARRFFNEDGSNAGFAFHHPIGETLGNGIATPIANRLTSSSTETERYGGALKLDFRPDERTDLWATLAVSILDQEVFATENDVRQPLFCFAFLGCSISATQRGGATGTGAINVAQAAESIFSDSTNSENNSKLYGFQFGGDHRVNSDWTLEGRASLSAATQKQAGLGFFYSVPSANARFRFDYDLADPANPIMNVDDPDRIFDPATYQLQRANLFALDLREDNLDLKINAGFNVADDDTGLGLKGGIRYKQVDREYSASYDQFNTSDLGKARFTLDQVLSPVSGRDLDIPNTHNLRTLLQDIGAARRLVGPQINDTSLFTHQAISDLINEYAITEKTAAGFVYVRYVSNSLHINAGLRYEKTDNDASGFVQSSIGTLKDATGNLFTPTSTRGSQDFFLPSATLIYDLREDLKLRLAYSKTLGRPAYNSLAPQGDRFTTAIDPDKPETLGNPTASRTIANPDLRPRQSDNFDLALEWYIDEGAGILSLGYFNKDIKDEIFADTRITTEQISFPGLPRPLSLLVTTSTLLNASKASLDGVEFNLVKNLGFIPVTLFNDIGVALNFTWMDGDFDGVLRTPIGGGDPVTPGFLPGQPEKLGNVALFYSTEKLDLNVGVNYVGDVVTFFNSDPNAGAGQDVYNLSRTTVNAKAVWRFRENANIFLEANNLTREQVVRFSGDPSLRSIRRRFATGRSFSLGVNYTF